MNRSATALLTVTVGGLLAVAPVSAAFADEVVPPAPATYDEFVPGVLDCTASTVTFVTIHWAADAALVDGAVVYGDWVESSRSAEIGSAGGEDCPEWSIAADDEGVESWVYTAPVVVAPEVEPVVVADPVVVEHELTPEEVAEFFRTA